MRRLLDDWLMVMVVGLLVGGMLHLAVSNVCEWWSRPPATTVTTDCHWPEPVTPATGDGPY